MSSEDSKNIPAIGLFWDVENCQVPKGCSAIDVASTLRATFVVGKREVFFILSNDMSKECSRKLDKLNDIQLDLVHVKGCQKNSADAKLRKWMRKFAEIVEKPSTLVLISSDVNFSNDLIEFRYSRNMEVILVHGPEASDLLIKAASSHYSYNELVQHLPRTFSVVPDGFFKHNNTFALEIRVIDLPKEIKWSKIRKRLEQLADNCGGRVVTLKPPIATIRFRTLTEAERAKYRMHKEDVYGYQIATRFIHAERPGAESYSVAITGASVSSSTDVKLEASKQIPSRCLTHAPFKIKWHAGDTSLKVFISLGVLQANVCILLKDHDGFIPLISFIDCYEAAYGQMCFNKIKGVALELLLRSLSAVELKSTPDKMLCFKTNDYIECRVWTCRQVERLTVLKREIADLLSTKWRCLIAVKDLRNSYKCYYGKQCRPADYGFHDIRGLIEAINDTVCMFGAAPKEMLTLTRKCQTLRWNYDLSLCLNRAQDSFFLSDDIWTLYQQTFRQKLYPVNYGVCSINDLLSSTWIELGQIASIIFKSQLNGEDMSSRIYDAVTITEYQNENLVPVNTVILPAAYVSLANKIRPIVPAPVKEINILLSERYKEELSIEENEVNEDILFKCGFTIINGTVTAAGGLLSSWAQAVTAVVWCVEEYNLPNDWFVKYTLSSGSPPPIWLLHLTGVISNNAGKTELSSLWRVVIQIARSYEDPSQSLACEDIIKNFKEKFTRELPYRELGFDTLEEMLHSLPEFFKDDGNGLFFPTSNLVVSPK